MSVADADVENVIGAPDPLIMVSFLDFFTPCGATTENTNKAIEIYCNVSKLILVSMMVVQIVGYNGICPRVAPAATIPMDTAVDHTSKATLELLLLAPERRASNHAAFAKKENVRHAPAIVGGNDRDTGALSHLSLISNTIKNWNAAAVIIQRPTNPKNIFFA